MSHDCKGVIFGAIEATLAYARGSQRATTGVIFGAIEATLAYARGSQRATTVRE